MACTADMSTCQLLEQAKSLLLIDAHFLIKTELKHLVIFISGPFGFAAVKKYCTHCKDSGLSLLYLLTQSSSTSIKQQLILLLLPSTQAWEHDSETVCTTVNVKDS